MKIAAHKFTYIVIFLTLAFCAGAVYLASDFFGYSYPKGIGEGSLQVPLAMQGAEIVDKRGSIVPSDIVLTNHLGQSITFGELVKHNATPKLLTIGYYECPMLCNLVLNGLVDSLKKVSLHMGKDYDVISVSINPLEKFELAAQKRENYLKSASLEPADSIWTFSVGQEKEVKRLSEAVGFGYRYDDSIKQYAHAAGVFVLSPDGRLSRTLYGIEYKPADIKYSLVDASAGKIGSLMDRVMLTCFHYDPDSHKYGLYIFGLVRVVGLLTVLILGTVLLVLWRKDRRFKTA